MLQSSTQIQLEKRLFPSLLELKSPLLARLLLQVILPRHHLLLQVALRLARLLRQAINQLGRLLGRLHLLKAHLQISPVHRLRQVSLPLAHLLLQVALRLARLLLLPINQLGRLLGLLHPQKAHLLGHQVHRVRQKNPTCEVEICLMIRL